MNKLLLMSLLAQIGIITLLSQATPIADPKPSPPFIKRAPAKATWIMTVKYKPNPNPAPSPSPSKDSERLPPPEPQKLLARSLVTKYDSTIQDVRIYTDGSKSENWVLGGMLLRQHPQKGYVGITNPRIISSAPRYDLVDFENLAWIDLAHYVKTEDRDGVRCHLYLWTQRMPSASDMLKIKDRYQLEAITYAFENKPEVPTKAWIMEESRLPLAIEDENAVYTFKFEAPPEKAPSMPQGFIDLWNEYQNEQKSIRARAMPIQR